MSRTRLGLAARIAAVALAGLTGLAGLPARVRAANPAQFAITVQMVPAPVPVVAKTVDPATPGIGGPLAFRIVVTNAGAGTVTGLTVVDTVSPVLVSGVTAQPALFAPTVTSVAGAGTRYEWTGTGLTLGPNASFTFTVTGRAGFVCAPTGVGNTAYVVATGPGGRAQSFSPAAGFVLQPPSASMSIVKTMAPAVPVTGGPLNYTIAVTNTGAATITGLVVTDTVSPVMGAVTATTPGGFTFQPVAQMTGGTLYSWTSSAPLYPGATATFQLDGTVGMVPSTTTIGNTSYAAATTACGGLQAAGSGPTFTLGPSVVLSAGLTVSQPLVSTGQSFLVMMTVTNTGAGTASSLSGSVWSGSAAASWTGTPATTTAGSLGPGASVVFTWTATAASVGAISWTGTVSAAEAAAAASASPAVTVQSAASLVATASAVPGSVCSGAPVMVVVNVTNTGATAANGVNIVGFLTNGTGGFGAFSAPNPSMPAVIAGGGSQSFTWTTSGGALGVPWLSTTVTGTDAFSGLPVASGPVGTGSVTVDAPAVLVGALSVPSAASVGQTVTVALTVTNTGGVNATGVGVSGTTTAGSGTFGAAPSAQTIGPAGSWTYSWPYTVQSAGVHAFSVTASGLTCGSTAVTVLGAGSLTAVNAAVLSGTLIVTTPTPTTTGSLVVVTLTVTNTGGASANGVSANLTPVGAAGTLGGPFPAGPVVIAGTGQQTFVWTYTTSGSGGLSFNWTAAGTDDNSGLPVSASAVGGGGMQVMTPAALVATATAAPGSVCSGEGILLVVNVTNTGQASATGVNIVGFLTHGSGGFGAFSGSNPAMPATIPGGTTQPFTWTVTGGAAGTAWLSTTVSGTDAVSLLPVASGATGTGPVVISTPAVLVAALSVPPTASVGQTVTVALTVTNTGGVNATGVAVSGTTTSGSGTFGAAPASQTIAPAGSWTYSWPYTVQSAGVHAFSLTASGMTCGATPVSVLRTGTLTATAPAVLSGTLIVTTPTPTTVGSLVVVTLTVTNTGGASANGVSANLAPVGVAGVLGGPAPAGPVVIAGGGQQVFVWTYTTSGAGALSFNWSAAGTDANSGLPVSASAVGGGGMQVVAPAALSVSVAAAPATVCATQPFLVTVQVTNTGGAAANGVNAGAFVVSGAGSAVLSAGPNPALPATIPAGLSQVFTWTYTGGTAGSVWFTATVTATDAVSTAAISSGPRTSGPVAVDAVAVIAASLAVTPPTASIGQVVSLTLTVTNTGGAAATGVTGALTAVNGTGSVGGSPGAQTINGGATGSFGWTYTVGSAGAHVFSVTVSGLSCASIAVGDVTGAAMNAVAPAALSATLIVTTPGVSVAGQLVVVTMTVTNTGTANATGVTAGVSASGAAGVLGGPFPAGPLVIAGGGSQTFIWTYTTTGGGTLSFGGSAGGTDANSGLPIGTGGLASESVAVSAPAVLVAWMDVPGSVVQGTTASVTVFVQNTGGTDMTVNNPIAISEADPLGLITSSSGYSPATPALVAAGTIQPFFWTYDTAVSCGYFSTTAFVDATEALTGKALGPVFMGASIGVTSTTFTVAGFSVPARVEVGGRSFLTFSVRDTCSPPVEVSNVQVLLTIIGGNGRVEGSGNVSDGDGKVSGTLYAGYSAGMNVVRAEVVGGGNATTVVSVEGVTPSTIRDFLSRNFFDPGRGEKLGIRVQVPAAVRLSVRVYNLAGELIRVIRSAEVLPGLTVWEWDGRNDLGMLAGNGTYFVQIVAGRDTQIRKVVILKR